MPLRPEPGHRRLAATAALGLGLGLAGASGLASGGRGDVMKVSEVRPGMRGHAVTVFSGEQPDRFEIEVIDVIADFQPGQDAVLFTSSDPRLEHSGIVGGMSGSPVFVEGKLLGALAYGWSFNKDPIGGITPIEDMLAVDQLPFRPEVLPGGRPRTREGTAAWADAMLGLGVSPLPERRRPAELDPRTALEPIGVPLTLGGFGPGSSGLLADVLGMVPVRGGSSGRARRGQDDRPRRKKFAPGDSVSVIMIEGDLNAAPNGTVTWVGGKSGERLLAFGHPMFEQGPTRYPIADARVHVILPSLERSVKMSSPLDIQGTMIQDRLAAISARTDIQAPLIPVTTRVVAADDRIEARTYQSRVADSVLLTPSLVATLMFQALETSASDTVELTVAVEHDIGFRTRKGPRTVHIEEEFFFPTGIARGPLLRGRAILAMAAAIENDFEVAEIRHVDQRMTVRYGAPVETIREVQLVSGEVRAGDLMELDVRLRPPHGDERTERIVLRVPDDAEDQEIMVEIAGGDYVLPYRPVPRSADDLLDTIAGAYPSRAIVASIYREAEGLATEYGLMTELPDSVLETLSPSGATLAAVRFKRLARRVLPSATIIEGEHRLKVNVLPRKLSSR
jgi:hypothetical protein